MKITLYGILIYLLVLSACNTTPTPVESFDWPTVERTWIGPDFWANRLQDWKIENGRLHCIYSGSNRNLYVLTREIVPENGAFSIEINFNWENKSESNGWLGFRVGVNGTFDDYRDSAVRGTGLNAGITRSGKLFIGEVPETDGPVQLLSGVLSLDFDPATGLTLTLKNSTEPSAESISIESTIDPSLLSGGIALVSHFESNQMEAAASFGNFSISGPAITIREEQRYGPILFNQYTISRGNLRYTAQLTPVGSSDDKLAYFQIQEGSGWKTIAEASVDTIARTATFTMDKWTADLDVPYRVEYGFNTYNGKKERHFHEGTIRKDPTDKQELVVAAFTGNNDLGFPNKDLTDNVVLQNPDFLFFSGDQLYEGVGGYGVERAPLDRSILDYLRKWYIFGWTYKELLRDIPAVSIPDDHDVYHGNIWGAGGIATPAGLRGNEAQDQGGYKMPAPWVNMVQHTQTSHFPDPYDPTPVAQDIGVYYTDIVYGGVSFAVLEDRKFKSAPKPLLPEADIDNGWAQNRSWDAKLSADVAGAILLGDRQEQFLANWVKDWSYHAEMKVVLSQTIFANVATLPSSEYHDAIVPKLRILKSDEYPPDDRPVSDMDSNGWPQKGRNNAIRLIRKGFSFHLAGDQHLGSFIQYGVDEFGDAGFALCVPSVSNVWPRRWYPPNEGENHQAGEPRYTGDFLDGFGNKMTVRAVSNPVFTGREPANLYDRATGYGILKINRNWRSITAECWPRDINPTEPDAKQYPGWPIMTSQLQSYSTTTYGHLPEMEVQGISNPVFEVYDESDQELLYSIRVKGNSFHPFVFKEGKYTVRVSEPDLGLEKVIKGLVTGEFPLMLVELE